MRNTALGRAGMIVGIGAFVALGLFATTGQYVPGAGGGVVGPAGGGTANTLPKFTSANQLGNSSITDNGTTTTIGTNGPQVTNANGAILFPIAGASVTIQPSISCNAISAGAITLTGAPLTIGLGGTSGHVVTVGAAVSFSSCGTGPACNSTTCNDIAGTFTVGSAITTCTITFAGTYTGADDAGCIVYPIGTATQPVYTTTATTIVMSVAIASQKYKYICIGH